MFCFCVVLSASKVASVNRIIPSLGVKHAAAYRDSEGDIEELLIGGIICVS